MVISVLSTLPPLLFLLLPLGKRPFRGRACKRRDYHTLITIYPSRPGEKPELFDLYDGEISNEIISLLLTDFQEQYALF